MRAGSTRQSSSSGLCRVSCQSGSSMDWKRLRASRLQLHQRFIAMAARPSMRAGRYGMRVCWIGMDNYKRGSGAAGKRGTIQICIEAACPLTCLQCTSFL